MAKTIFAGNPNSQYDSDLIIKDVHDFHGQALRTLDTRTIVDSYYSHFVPTYDNLNRPVNVKYYLGTQAHQTSFSVSTVNPLLNNKYFILYSATGNQKWCVWFNVDGNGTVPSVSDAQFIEVAVNDGDTGNVLALAITLTINGLAKDHFTVTRNFNNVSILNTQLGEVSPSFEGTTPYEFSQKNGEQKLVKDVNISYDGADPVYENQVLRGYTYDILAGKFNKNPELQINAVEIKDADGDKLKINTDGSINVNVVSTGQILRSHFFEIDNVPTGVTEQLCSYIPTNSVYLQKIEVSGTNISTYELYIDGIKQDKKITYFSGSLDTIFEFNQGLNVSAGQEIEVRVYHNRPNVGAYSARMQILEE